MRALRAIIALLLLASALFVVGKEPVQGQGGYDDGTTCKSCGYDAYGNWVCFSGAVRGSVHCEPCVWNCSIV